MGPRGGREATRWQLGHTATTQNPRRRDPARPRARRAATGRRGLRGVLNPGSTDRRSSSRVHSDRVLAAHELGGISAQRLSASTENLRETLAEAPQPAAMPSANQYRTTSARYCSTLPTCTSCSPASTPREARARRAWRGNRSRHPALQDLRCGTRPPASARRRRAARGGRRPRRRPQPLLHRPAPSSGRRSRRLYRRCSHPMTQS